MNPFDTIQARRAAIFVVANAQRPKFFRHGIAVNAMRAGIGMDHAISTTAGVNHPQTSWNALKIHALAVPPLAEQQAIASVLRTVQGAKEAGGQVLAATRKLKQSLLHHLFTYGPVPFSQAAHVPLQATEIGEAPEHWTLRQLGELAAVKGGKRLLKRSTFAEAPPPVPL